MKLVVAVVSASVLATGHAQAQNTSYVVQSNVQIGPYKLSVDPTLHGAIEIFGAPTRIKRGPRDGWNSCTARWAEHGVNIWFYNLAGQDSCKPQYGAFGRATLTDRRWRTAKALRIGDTFQKLTRLYRPRHFRGQWAVLLSELRRAACSLPNGCLFPKLEAKMMDGRVVAFRVNATAGGV